MRIILRQEKITFWRSKRHWPNRLLTVSCIRGLRSNTKSPSYSATASDSTKRLLKQCDLIFIDGSHAYSYVKNDTEKALRMLKEGGLLLWHDYRYRNLETRGVRQYLDELSETLPLIRLDETTIVAYRNDTKNVAAD